MSELEQKRESSVKAEQDQKQQQEISQDVSNKPKQEEDNEAEVESTHMPWEAHVDTLMARLSRYVGNLGASMGHNEFRSAVNSYRELSPMGRRSVANRLQRNHLNALLRAIHTGDYRLYQETWMQDAEEHERRQQNVVTAEPSTLEEDGG